MIAGIDADPAYPGLCAGRDHELVGIERVEWEFVGRELADADMLCVDLGE
jgi:hypothetical protein